MKTNLLPGCFDVNCVVRQKSYTCSREDDDQQNSFLFLRTDRNSIVGLVIGRPLVSLQRQEEDMAGKYCFFSVSQLPGSSNGDTHTVVERRKVG